MAAVRIIVFVCWTTHEGSVVVQRRCHNLTLMRFVLFDFLLFKLLCQFGWKVPLSVHSFLIDFWEFVPSNPQKKHVIG